MRRYWASFGCALVLVLLASALPACAEHHERKRVERVEILALEQKWRQAQLVGDIPEMDKLLSDEFVGVTASGQVVTKGQQLDRMRTRSLDIQRLDLSETKIKISGNLAVVTSLAQIDGVAEGAPLRGAYRYTRVYQHVPGDGWKITNFEATHVGRGQPSSPQASSAAPPAVGPSSHPASPAAPASQLPRS
jgi:ketosteroid isomerase-like protein